MIVGSELVKSGDARPAGRPDQCLYCRAPMGGMHNKGCVILQRTVVIKVTIEVVVDVPRDWETDTIDFRYNESSWCATNFIDDLSEWKDRVEEEVGPLDGANCLCGAFGAAYQREATAEDHQSLPILTTLKVVPELSPEAPPKAPAR